MTHDPLCPQPKCDYGSFNDDACHGFSECPHRCQCDLISKARAEERSRKGTCWREAEGSQVPAGAIRVYREAGWFWEMP